MQYLSILSSEHVLPVQVFSVRFVRQVAHILKFFFFKLSYDFRIYSGQNVAVFSQWCFASTAITWLFQAEKENLMKEVVYE